MKKLRAEVVDAKADAEKARTAQQTEVTKLQQHAKDLAAQLEAAKKVAGSAEKQIEALKTDNKELTGKVETGEKQIAGLKEKLTVKPIESPELKKLRADLADSEKAMAAQQVDVAKLQSQTKDLTAQLDTAKEAAAAKPVESPELKKLRTELADSEKNKVAQQAEVAKLQVQTKDLTAQLDAAKAATTSVAVAAPANDEEIKQLRTELANTKADLAAAKSAAVVQPAVTTSESAEVKQLRAELARTKADLELAQKIGHPNLTANEELSQLRPAYARARAEAEENKRLAARAELDRAERAAMARHLTELERTNNQLREQIGSPINQPTTKITIPTKPAAIEPDQPRGTIVTTGKPAAGNEEITRLRAELADAKSDAAKSRQDASRVSDLERENKMLNAKLAEASKAPVVTKTVSATQNFTASATEAPQQVGKPVESPELKKLRVELADAKADADKARSAQQAELSKLQQQTKDLAAQLDAAKKTTAAKPVEQTELKKLRNDLADAKAEAEKARTAQQREVAKLQQDNKDLTSQLDATKKVATAKPVESPELKKLRVELADAKADAEKARSAQQAELIKLQQQSKDLASQLDATKKTAAVKPVEQTELKKTNNAELANAKAALNKVKSELAASQKVNQDELTVLQNKNKALTSDLDAAKKQVGKSAEVVKLRQEIDIAWAEAEKQRQAAARVNGLEREIKTLTAQLAEVRKASTQSAQNFAPATADTATRQDLEKQITDLKAQLKKLQPAAN